MYIILQFSTAAYFGGTNSSKFFQLKSDISQLLTTIGNIAGAVMAMLGAKVVWFEQDKILRFLQDSRVESFSNTKLMSLRNVKIFIVTITLSMYTQQILFAAWLDPTSYKAMDQTFSILRSFVNGVDGTICRIVLTIFTKIIEIFYVNCTVIYVMPRVLLITTLVQLKGLGMQFEEFLEQTETIWNAPTETMCWRYERLRNTVDCASSLVGGILLSIYVSMLAFLANLPEILRDETETKMSGWAHIFYCLVIGTFLVIGADLPKRVIHRQDFHY